MAKLRITYTKSSIGYSRDQKATVRSLGLHKLNSTVVQEDTPPIRGMIFKIRHLVSVEDVPNDTPTTSSWRTRQIAAAREQSTSAAANAAPKTVVKPPTSAAASTAPAAVVEEPVSAAESAAPAAVVEEPTSAAESAAPAADDLTVIEGIGPKIAEVLQAAGVHTFDDLAAMDIDNLTEILQAANLRLASPETWAEQAQLAAAGDWDGLKQLQDQLKGGRRE
jgi:ribosomal protein L30